MSSQQAYKMIFAILCSVLISSACAAVTTVSPVTQFFAGYDTNPKDGVVTNAEFHKAAYTYDVNGDGNITRAEFSSLYHARLGVPLPQAEGAFDAIDLNHDRIFDDKEISAIYNVFDGNGDGQMTPDEFLTGFSRFTSGHGASG